MFKKDDQICILGRKRSGKSYLARRVQECYPRKVIFDCNGEYRDFGDRCVSFDDFAEKLVAAHDKKEFTLVYPFGAEGGKKEAALFDHALRALFRRGEKYKSPTLIVVEEVQNFATTHVMPHWLRRCIMEGGHVGLALLFTTQRPGRCHKDIIAESGHVFIGSLHDEDDVGYARSAIGKERASELKMLKTWEDHKVPSQFFYFRPGTGTLKITNDFQALEVSKVDGL